MTAEQDRIRLVAKAAADKFAADYAIVVMPKPLTVPLNMELVEQGMDLAVLEDGEDDGMMMLIVVPRSSAMLKSLTQMKRNFNSAMAWFMVTAACVVISEAFALSGYATAWCALLMTCWAIRALTTHHRLARKRRAYDELRKAGF